MDAPATLPTPPVQVIKIPAPQPAPARGFGQGKAKAGKKSAQWAVRDLRGTREFIQAEIAKRGDIPPHWAECLAEAVAASDTKYNVITLHASAQMDEQPDGKHHEILSVHKICETVGGVKG